MHYTFQVCEDVPSRYRHWTFEYTTRQYDRWFNDPPKSVVSWLLKWPKYYFSLKKIPNRFVRMALLLTYPITIIPVCVFCTVRALLVGIFIVLVAMSLLMYHFTFNEDGTIQKVWKGEE